MLAFRVFIVVVIDTPEAGFSSGRSIWRLPREVSQFRLGHARFGADAAV